MCALPPHPWWTDWKNMTNVETLLDLNLRRQTMGGTQRTDVRFVLYLKPEPRILVKGTDKELTATATCPRAELIHSLAKECCALHLQPYPQHTCQLWGLQHKEVCRSATFRPAKTARKWWNKHQTANYLHANLRCQEGQKKNYQKMFREVGQHEWSILLYIKLY